MYEYELAHSVESKAGSHLLLLACGFVFASVLTSCSNGGPDPLEVEKQAAVEALAADAPEAQAAAFEDGVISDDEYSVAVLASYECFVAGSAEIDRPQGVRVDLRVPTRNLDLLEWSYGIGGPDEDELETVAAGLEAIENDCRTSLSSSVEEAFLVQSIPTGSERSRMLDELVQCTERAGTDLPDGFNLDKVDQIEPESLEAFSVCAVEFPRLFISTRR